jgi:hypothetical protein
VGYAPITLSTKGRFSKTVAYLEKLKRSQVLTILNHYGSQGVAALAGATPVDTGLAASSWYYTVGAQDHRYWIDFHNSDIVAGTPVVILIQYGHATKNGGYVMGRDFINPAIAPIFDAIKNDVWREVTKL